MPKNLQSFLAGILFLMLLNSCIVQKPIIEPEVTPPPVTIEEPEDTIAEEKEVQGEVVTEVVKPEPVETIENKKDVPHTFREFRAAWVATVANINWPSRPGLSPKEQQQEAIELLDMLKAHNFNAVILQVRPQADALYASELEPWSYFLTGKQGQAPEPFYDPLHFWIEAAHDRGLELHAWLNPYRAHHTTGGEISAQSIVKTHPELVVKLKDGQYWMDPSKEGTQKHATAVVMDIVERYDIDGIHFDDYFYPYDSYNGGKDFPDDESWSAYQKSGGKLSRGDWRRESVNNFIENLYHKIKEEKSSVKFGISPFGIWRPGYPESIAGYDQYDKLYADARLWLNEGWVDYFTPQLYWGINKTAQSFPVLLGWWKSENTQKRHLWPGINIGLGGDEKNIDETINQIMITRGMLPKSPGAVHWSIGPLVKYPNLATAILEGPYQKEALVPASPWLDNTAPAAPVAVPEVKGDKLNITWVPGDEEEIFRWVVYLKYGSNWSYEILDKNANSIEISRFKGGSGKNPISAIAVTAVDRTGNESEFREVKL